MDKDQRYMLAMMAKTLGTDHFSLTRLHRAVYPKRAAQWIPFDQDGLRRDMKRMVRDGLAVESTGPRGGTGWTLTAAALHAVSSNATDMYMLPAKIERRCPRCGTHAYHWLTDKTAQSAIKTTKRHTATCAHCGHSWPCRVMQRDL